MNPSFLGYAISKRFQLYRHSYKAQYTIINFGTKARTALRADDTVTGLDLFLVEWAPVGKNLGAVLEVKIFIFFLVGFSGNALVYVFENNIYYRESAESDGAVRITNTSRTEFVFNGIPDWVYEGMLW